MKAHRKPRIFIKLTASEARRLSTGARLVRTTLRPFLIQSAVDKARKPGDGAPLYFSPEDAVMFIDRIEHPSPPNARLADAINM